jgi:putative membrane protein
MLDAIKEGYREIFQKKFNRIAIVCIVLISMLFGLLCVIAFWSPDEKLKEFPVAVINLDEGEYGKEIIESLRENDQVKWEFYEENIFQDGIENTEYSFGFLIPEDFSESVQSAQSGTPQQAEIVYFSNMRKNYMLSQFSRNVKTALETTVSSSITRSYVTETFETLYDIKDGLTEATDGARKLSEGSTHLKDGVSDLSKGAVLLNTGALDLRDGNRLFVEKMGLFADGASSLKNGTDQLNAGASEIADAIGEITLGSSSLSANMDAVGSGILQSSSSYQAAMDQLLAGYGGILGNPSITDAEKVVALTTLYANLDAAYRQYQAAESQIDLGVYGLMDGATALKNGTEALNATMPGFTSGTSSLALGAAELEDSSLQLQEGSLVLLSGAEGLADGTSTLNQSIEALESGTSELADGANELHASLSESVEDMEENLVNSPEEMGAFIAEPVSVSPSIYGEVNSFGAGLSPLFMSIGLWIGSLMLFFVIRVKPSKAAQMSRSQIVFGRYINYLSFGIIEALAITGGALWIGIEVTNIPIFMLFACLVSLVFLGIIQFVHLLFGDLVSKGLCVILVILQVSAGGGTFPVELTRPFFVAIHPFLPFSYSIDGFREIISGGNWQSLIATGLILFSILIGVWILSLLCCKRRSKRLASTNQNEPLVS